jgi:hypothetical protein
MDTFINYKRHACKHTCCVAQRQKPGSWERILCEPLCVVKGIRERASMVNEVAVSVERQSA